MQQGLIGVIVPIYKVEKYIAECIESILAQTYTKFRLILVDDGTPDNAGKICDEYAKKDSRITVIHQENAGVTRARARGVEEAYNCEFITFVDSDDTVKKDALEKLICCVNDDTDIVITPVDKHVKREYSLLHISEYRSLLIKNISLIDTPWGKLFRKNIFNDFVFDIPADIIVHEDSLMNIRLAFNTDKNVVICKSLIYNYRQNENSVFHTVILNLDYLQKYHELRILSIPTNQIELYFKDTIYNRFIKWQEKYMYRYSVTGMKKERFYQELRKDIKRTKYRLSFTNKILFYNTNIVIRVIAVNMKKLSNICKKVKFTK